MATGSARCAARRAVDSLQTSVTTRAGKIQSNRALEKRRQQMRLTALSGAVDNVERVGGARRGCRLNPTTRYHRHSERRVHSGASSASNRRTDLYRTYGGKESADQSSRVESSRESGVLRSCATSRGAPSQLRRGKGRHGWIGAGGTGESGSISISGQVVRSEDVSAAATTGLGEGVDSTKALAARGTAQREVEAEHHFNFGSDLHGRPTAVPVQEGE